MQSGGCCSYYPTVRFLLGKTPHTQPVGLQTYNWISLISICPCIFLLQGSEVTPFDRWLVVSVLLPHFRFILYPFFYNVLFFGPPLSHLPFLSPYTPFTHSTRPKSHPNPPILKTPFFYNSSMTFFYPILTFKSSQKGNSVLLHHPSSRKTLWALMTSHILQESHSWHKVNGVPGTIGRPTPVCQPRQSRLT